MGSPGPSRRVVSDPDRFEVWDGGHCCIRAVIRGGSEVNISMYRWPEHVDIQDAIEFGEWAKTVREANPSTTT